MSRRLDRAARSVRGPVAALAAAALLAGCTAGGADATATASGSPGETGGTTTSGGPAGGSPSSAGATPTPTVTVTGSSGEDGAASEILPETSPDPSPTLGVDLPHLTQAPTSASAHGTLVTGFPSDLVPVPAHATVVSSSISSQGVHVQVGLSATEDGEPDRVGADYTARMTTLGYLTTDVDAAPGSDATQYVRGRDVVVLTLRPRTGGGTELVITGALVVGG